VERLTTSCRFLNILWPEGPEVNLVEGKRGFVLNGLSTAAVDTALYRKYSRNDLKLLKNRIISG